MRTRNPAPAHTEGIERGHTGATRAGTPGTTFADTSGNEVTAPTAQLIGGQVSGQDGDTAYLTISGTGSGSLTNNSGDVLAYGDVVVLDTDGSVTTTVIEQDPRPAGVVQIGGGDGDPVAVVFAGFVEQINCVESVASGAYGETSATAGDAQSNPTIRQGSFCQFTSDGETPSAYLFGLSAPTSPGEFEETDPTAMKRLGGTGGQALFTSLDCGSAIEIDLSAWNLFHLVLTANCVLSFTGASEAGPFFDWGFNIVQGGSGNYTLTWPASVSWRDTAGLSTASAPTLATAVDAQDAFTLNTQDGGTTYGAALDNGGGTPASTVTDETTFGITPAVGTDTEYARQGHTHGSPPNPVTEAAILALVGSHVHVAYETHTSDGATTTFTLDQIYEPGSVMAWNRTTGTMFGVTEVLPDQVTLSAAGTAADLIDFHYAATVI